MALNTTNINTILGITGFILVAYCLWEITSLNKLRKNFFAGTRALDLESVIETLRQELSDSRERQTILEQSFKDLRKSFGFAIQKIGMVRFNPFNDGGGNFSFTIALLDEHNSGIILTSMHGREQNRIYTKKLENGTCSSKLTDEEQQAVIEAEAKYQTN